MGVFWGGKQATPLPPRFFRRQDCVDGFGGWFAGGFLGFSVCSDVVLSERAVLVGFGNGFDDKKRRGLLVGSRFCARVSWRSGEMVCQILYLQYVICITCLGEVA